MFVVSILLGTIITSLFVYSRAASYEASILVALAGEPELMANMNSQQVQQNPESSPARRKANRLAIWIQRTPEFLKNVVEDAQLDKKYPSKNSDAIARDVRKHLSEPSLLNDMYMELKVTWNNPDEAEAIMNRLYSRFSEQTLTAETSIASRKRQALEAQLEKANKEADEKAKARIKWMAERYNEMPSMMQAKMSQFELFKRTVSDAKLELVENETRLKEVLKQLATTPKEVNKGTETTDIRIDPALQAKAERDSLVRQINELLLRYTEDHPIVKEQRRRIQAADVRIVELQREPNRQEKSSTITRKEINPNWQILDSRRQELEQAVSGASRKITQLNSDINDSQGTIKKMPSGEVAFGMIEREWKLAENIRQHTQNMLSVARLDEDRDRMTQALIVHLEVAPKAEKVDSGGKVLMLYALGPLLGIVIAFCFSLVSETLDHPLRTPVEVERYLGKPVLAVIPRMQTPKEARKKLDGGSSRPSISS